MICLPVTEDDNPLFLLRAQRVLNGALDALKVREAFVVSIDNWFDHKWLGWRSRWRRREVENLRIPLFTPNRVRSERRYVRDAAASAWQPAAHDEPLHLKQPGRTWLAKPLPCAEQPTGFFWYSGNTVGNQVGSIMFYLSTAGGYSWHASLQKREEWVFSKVFHTSPRELERFERIGGPQNLENV